jgi:hypothetical protein
MKKATMAVFISLSSIAFAENSGLKPGLWEVKPTSQVVDGRDMTAQIAESRARMQQAIANMPPEQRQSMMNQMPAQSADGSMRICVSPEMAAKDQPMIDHTGHCPPAKVTRDGNRSSFEFNCTTDGHNTVGKGERVVNGGSVTTRVDMTMTDARGSHTVHTESQMKYLGSDCQGIKPLDQIAR